MFERRRIGQRGECPEGQQEEQPHDSLKEIDQSVEATKSDSSEESWVGYRLRYLAKRVIEGQFEYPIGAKALGFSHGDLSLVVQALYDPTGNQLLSPEVVRN